MAGPLSGPWNILKGYIGIPQPPLAPPDPQIAMGNYSDPFPANITGGRLLAVPAPSAALNVNQWQGAVPATTIKRAAPSQSTPTRGDVNLCAPSDIPYSSGNGEPYLDQGMYDAMQRFRDEAASRGMNISFYPTFRDADIQSKMPANTKAPGDLSSHMAGRGGDVKTINGQPLIDWSPAQKSALIQSAQAAGLRSGNSFGEPWHVDQWGGLTADQRQALIAQAQAQRQAGNIPVCITPAKR